MQVKKQNSTYHRVLRVSAVVCAVALVFESGLLNESTAKLAQNTHSYLANVIGMSAAVNPTELNEYTAALTQKERELTAREESLREREISVGLETGAEDNEKVVYILASILFILLVLIVLNYALDYLRNKEVILGKTV